MDDIVLYVLFIVLGIAIGIVCGILVGKKQASKKFDQKLSEDANNIIKNAEADAARLKAEAAELKADADKLQAKAEAEIAQQREKIQVEKTEALEKSSNLLKEAEQEIAQKKAKANQEINELKAEVNSQEQKILAKEKRLDDRSDKLDKREDTLDEKERLIEEKKNSIEEEYNKVGQLIEEQNKKLMDIAALTEEQAKAIVIDRTEEKMTSEIAKIIKEKQEEAEATAKRDAQGILTNAIQQYAGEIISERTTATVTLPNEDLKGRIIGREGRNIKSIETICGVDIIIDDTPDSVTISCFDPVRRETARRVLETLVTDGRIQPSRVEDLCAKYQKEMDNEIREAGERVIFETGIGRVNPEMVKILGRLKFRTSYGQNALLHSKEVAFLAGKMAVEVGLDERMARRAGLFHDIGKAADSETEGSHVEIGVQIAERYKEDPIVINAIASHHGDVPPTHMISYLVAAADTLSAARPGARIESIEAYIKRLQALEEICDSFKGVDKSYALQAGREIRIMVKPQEIDDLAAVKLSHDIKEKIETTLQYPGNIKVVVIRETRATDLAR